MLSDAQVSLERIAVCYAWSAEDQKAIEDLLALPECSWTDYAAKEALAAFSGLIEQGDHVNMLTVMHWMKQHGAMECWELLSQMDYMASPPNYRESLARISEYGRKRAVCMATALINQKAADPDVTADELDKFALQAITGGESVQDKKPTYLEPRMIGDVLEDYATSMEERRRHARRVPTGFPQLDQATEGGFLPGQMIVLAARPGLGKTSLGLQITRHVAKYCGPVLLFSLEMDEEENAERVVTQGTRRPKSIHRPQDARQFKTLPIHLFDKGNGLELTQKRIRRFLKAHPDCRLIVIDQLGNLVPKQKYDNRNSTVACVSQTLKHSVARHYKIPVLALHQIGRESERRGGSKRPTLADLKDSGNVEEDADIALLLWRKSYYEKTADNAAELIIAKNRSGKTGMVPLAWAADFVSYVSVEPSFTDEDQNAAEGFWNE